MKIFYIFTVIFLVVNIFATYLLLADNPGSGNYYIKVHQHLSILLVLVFFVLSYLMEKQRVQQVNASYKYYLFFYLILFYLPFITYACTIKASIEYIVYATVFVSLSVFLAYIAPIRFVISRSNTNRNCGRSTNGRLYWFFFILTIVVILTLTWYFTRFKLSLNIDGVYRTRALYKERSNFYLNVVKNTLGWFIVPVFLMNELNHKRRIGTTIMLVMGVLLFTWGKDKVYLFILFMAFVLYFMKHISIYKLRTLLIIGMVGGVVLSLILHYVLNNDFFYSTVIRRLFITPQDVGNKYFDFFVGNKKLLWRQDVFLIDKLFTPVYDKSYFKLIAESAYDNLVENPCTGALAESYAQWGWAGLIIYPIIIKGLLGILNFCMSNFDEKTKLLIIFNFTFLLIDSGVTTSDFFIEFILGCIVISVLNKRWIAMEDITYEGALSNI